MNILEKVGEHKINFVLGGLVVILLIIIALAIQPKEPVKIGYIGTLTGLYSAWGIAGRDGAHIAFDAVNKSGGINGRKIEFIIRDDEAKPELAANAVEQLIEEGVVAIIGPALSSTAKAALQKANKEKMLLISTSASSTAFTDIDDFFMRVCTGSGGYGIKLAEYMYTQRKCKNIGVTFSIANRAFTENAFIVFKDRFEELGGKIKIFTLISSSKDYKQIAKEFVKSSIEGIYMVAPSIDLSSICQELKLLNSSLPICVEGGKLNELINRGGDSVEDVVSATLYLEEEKELNKSDFAALYKQRFGDYPYWIVVYGYDAANVLIDALKYEEKWQPELLKNAIINISNFKSPLGEFTINKHGDTSRPPYIINIKNGKFVRAQ